jgi:hypothetical protein
MKKEIQHIAQKKQHPHTMNHVRLIYTGRLKKVKSAVAVANQILANPEFYRIIMNYQKFDNSSLSPDVIARLMQESNHEIRVRSSWMMFSSRVACYRAITVCRWNFSTDLARGVNQLIYETVAAIDCLYDILNGEEQELKIPHFTACSVIASIGEMFVLEKEKYFRKESAFSPY